MALSMDIHTVDDGVAASASAPHPAGVAPQRGSAAGRLESLLDRTAHDIAETGTAEVAATLRVLSQATGHLAPGAAAALVDRGGSEVARQRAFGIVHGVVLHELDVDARALLLDRLTGARPACSVPR